MQTHMKPIEPNIYYMSLCYKWLKLLPIKYKIVTLSKIYMLNEMIVLFTRHAHLRNIIFMQRCWLRVIQYISTFLWGHLHFDCTRCFTYSHVFFLCWQNKIELECTKCLGLWLCVKVIHTAALIKIEVLLIQRQSEETNSNHFKIRKIYFFQSSLHVWNNVYHKNYSFSLLFTKWFWRFCIIIYLHNILN